MHHTMKENGNWRDDSTEDGQLWEVLADIDNVVKGNCHYW
jgi:hypothetical protein